MKKLFFALCATYSLSAFAGPIEKLKEDNPGASTYTILQKLYESSTQAAQLSDFDRLYQPSHWSCVVVDKKSNVITQGPYKVYAYPYEKGHPAQGPLIPAVPDKTRDVLVNEILERLPASDYLDLIAAYTITEQTPTDLVMGMDKVPPGMNLNGGSLPARSYYRKNADLISAKMTAGSGSSMIVAYSYCWKQ